LTLFVVLLVFMIIGSIIAIEARNLLSAVISVGAVGFALSIGFLLLGAPDLAITQIVVEVIALILLIRGTISLDNTAIEKHRDTFAVISTLVFLGIFLVFGYVALQDMPKLGDPLMKVSQGYLQTGLQKTGAANIVMSIVLDFRGYDTLGEATVLFTSILGAFVVLRRRGRKRKEEKDRARVGIPGDL